MSPKEGRGELCSPGRRKIVHDWSWPDRLEARVVPKMDALWVVCEEQKQRLIADFGVPASKISLVLNTPEEIPSSSMALSTRRTRFGYHGILCEDRELEVILKGFDLFVDSCPDSERPQMSLLIAGGGESEEELRRLAAGLKYPGQIEFTGRYSPETLPGLYDRVDYGVVSLRANLFTEHTLANKFFDYAARGKPFLFPNLKPLARVIKDLKCGVAFAPGSPQSVAQSMRAIRSADYAALAQAGIRGIQTQYHWAQDAQRIQLSLEALGWRS